MVLYHTLQLAVLATVSLFIACKLIAYPIAPWRKFAAPCAFALIYSLPMGLLVHLLAPVALWILLKDPEVETRNRLPIFLMTYLFTALLTLMALQLTR